MLLGLSAACGGRVLDESSSVNQTSAAYPGEEPPSPVLASNPFHPGDDWDGTYSCAQGLTSLDVRIVATHDDVIDDALFLFDWNGGDVIGSYHLSGTFDPATARAVFTTGAWIDQPGAGYGFTSWFPVGLSGTVAGTRYQGDITHDSCGSFSLTKR